MKATEPAPAESSSANPEPDQASASGTAPEQPAAGKTAAETAPAEPTASEAATQPAAEKAPADSSAEPIPARRGRKVGGTSAKSASTIRDHVAQNVAKQVFRNHPDQRTVFVTADGTAFFGKCDAVNYGRILTDHTVVEITNPNFQA